MVAGMDPAWSGRGGGGGGGGVGGGGGGGGGGDLTPSYVGHVHRPPINLQVKSLLDYCIWIVIVVHSLLIIMLSLKLLYLVLSLIFFCFIIKNSTPPPWPGLGGAHPLPPVNSSQHVGFMGGWERVDRGTHPWPTGECKNRKGGGGGGHATNWIYHTSEHLRHCI
jgi:hypothetical protein